MSKFGKAYACFALLSILAGLILRSPALEVGLLADDWDHYAMSMRIYPALRSPFDHFSFVRSSASDHAALQKSGRLPWWIASDLRMALFRPLSSALGYVDYAWFDSARHPARMHLHSLVWWLSLVTGVACLLPLLLPLPAAALGTLLYALEDSHILPVTWIANRSELVANAFVVWAAYLRVLGSRRGDPRLLHAGAYALVAFSLLAGEHSIPALAYLAAFELCRCRPQLRSQLRALLPLALLIASLLIVRRLGGYGAAGLGMYVEPTEQPLRYLANCVQRLPLLFGDVVFGIAADWYPAGPPPDKWLAALPFVTAPSRWPSFQVVTGWIAFAGVAAILIALHARKQPELRAVFWLLLAAAASILPMCASVAMGRLTLPAAFGVDAAWAYFATELARRAFTQRSVAHWIGAGVVGAIVLGTHTVGAARRAWYEPKALAWLSQAEPAWVRLDGLDVADRNVMVLTSGCAAQWVIPFVRHHSGLPMPASSTPLSAAFLSTHELIRTATDAIELRLPARPSVATFTDSVYRSADHPFRTGDRVRTPNFDVHVLAAEGGEPTWLRFQFPKSVDDASYVFLYAGPQGFAPLALPPVGGRTTLRPAAWPQPNLQANTTP